MEKKFTIKNAVAEALRLENKPLTSKEIYEIILQKNLYSFKAKNPLSLINTELRSHCKGLELKTSKPDKIFKIVDDNKYSLL